MLHARPERNLLHTLRRGLLRPWRSRQGGALDPLAPLKTIAYDAVSPVTSAPWARFFALIDVKTAGALPVPAIAPLDWRARGIPLRRDSGCRRRSQLLNLTFKISDATKVFVLPLGMRKP